MKARIVYASPETNFGKLLKLDELHTAYRFYVQNCIDKMVFDKRDNVLLSECRGYFPIFNVLSSHIGKSAQRQAVNLIQTWIKQRYAHKLRKYLNTQDLTSHQKLELRCIGKYQLKKPGKFGKGIRSDSKRLARLEVKLSGQIKTITGTISNKLVKTYPNYTFVIEDLDLRGCRGQKRFAYRALHNSLSHKAKVEGVNPAYSSQMCPSCGYISRSNRSGVKFICQNCGRKSHADVIGAINLLGRSGDKQIDRCENPSEVRALLRERSLLKRIGSLDRLKTKEPKPNGQRFTTKGSENSDVGTASNLISDRSQACA